MSDRVDRENTAQTPSVPWRSPIAPIAPESTRARPVLVAEVPSVALPALAEGLPSNAANADDALRLAIKAAVDDGDFDRVKALVAVLEASPKPARVLDIATRRPKR